MVARETAQDQYQTGITTQQTGTRSSKSKKSRKKKMTNKKLKIVFEEGCFDSLSEELTEEELQEMMQAIEEQVADGTFFENSIPVDELSEEEQEEIFNMLNSRKNTRQ